MNNKCEINNVICGRKCDRKVWILGCTCQKELIVIKRSCNVCMVHKIIFETSLDNMAQK